MDDLERWCGIECTVSRVGDTYTDQLRRTGHHDRLDDLDRLAALGFTAIRYPLLWERVSPDSPDVADWDWCDTRMARLRDLGLRVIGGLVHHGSGPRYTNLLDDGFATGLARHAAAAAERYPWIEDWTPVNEPVTTARFSALYGHWYPHARDETAFWRALLNQIDATRLSMRAIRAVTPTARLIQTDDLGRAWATEPLAQRAAFDNQRRWIGWDLLCGRVTSGHPLWRRLCAIGFGDRLRTIADDPCPPDIIGINHYPTSDRFLDHRIQRYAGEPCALDAEQPFSDVPAVRALDPAPEPFAGALREAWERYGLPVALTEVHLGCTREEQMRWTRQAWSAATQARAAGVDVRAVTAWSVFGCQDWNTLITRPGVYESGLFDVTGGIVRPTALARQWQSIAEDGAEAVVDQPGWWQRPERLIFARAPRVADASGHRDHRVDPAKPLMICGASGTLGQALARACAARGIAYRLTTRAECDLGDRASVAAALDRIKPWAVINATGWVRVDDAEGEADACRASNVTAALRLVTECASRRIPVVALSSDLVFDGTLGRAYLEDDLPHALCVYGRSKVELEAGSLAYGYCPLVIRTASFFSPHDPHNFAHAVAQALSAGETFTAADDQVMSPSYVPALAAAVLDLLIDGEQGIRHLANDTSLSWADFARLIARALGHDPGRIIGVPGVQLGWTAPRPRSCGLQSRHVASLGPLTAAIADFAAHWRAIQTTAAQPIREQQAA
ncbi:sugar nucleotide-binding protein [Sphingomonas radiodurans]|uniref:sugar nucleotide-binding protein n=1 Tax=Sphingomonas radiodurans TaxID=2890321 RepID=UPI001E543D6E|nr:sugar nucleotide-binding protein [Sphingomonas radiodurans]WBH18144.1 sugar nucleotide-binding protein [Sphingomonas radiodurans]